MKKFRKKTVLNLVECEGAVCASVDDNDSRYYATNMKSRVLIINKIK